jgi:hypothetical protein
MHCLKEARMKASLLSAAVLLAHLNFMPAALADVPRYRVDAFTPPPDGFLYLPGKINNAGDIAGFMAPKVNGLPEAFISHQGKVTLLGNFGGIFSNITDLNERGDAIGYATDADSRTRPFMVRDGHLGAVPLPSGASGYGMALDLNNAGHVLGYAQDGAGVYRGFIYNGRSSRFLDSAGTRFPRYAAFNDRDVVAGDTETPGSSDQAPFIIDAGGHTTVLPLPPNDPRVWDFGVVTARDINNADQMLVNFHGVVDGHVDDVYDTYIVQAGHYVRFAPSGVDGVDLNEKGWVLGQIFEGPSDDVTIKPGIYRDGQFFRLADLVRPADAAQWTLGQPFALNDRGQVVGVSDHGVYIASPVPQPPSALLMLGGLSLLAGVRRRRGRAPGAA